MSDSNTSMPPDWVQKLRRTDIDFHESATGRWMWTKPECDDDGNPLEDEPLDDL
jgi:hypothetical protein